VAKTTRKPRASRKKPAEPIGLEPAEMRAKPPPGVEALCREIEADGAQPLAPYRDPLGGHWVILSAIPLEQVEPTPYQRGLSEAHVKRLADVISRMGRYLDPVIAVRAGAKKYQTPNGHHRASALKLLGARTITALVVTEPEVARMILALNVEKAHNLREKSMEAIRLARDLAGLPGMKESDFSLEFEDPSYLTLGLCYEERGRFAGGAYHPLLKRVDRFLQKPLGKSLEERSRDAGRLLEIDDRVAEHVQALKEKGLQSPYLKTFVVARLNPLRFRPDAEMATGEALEKMAEAAKRFDPSRIKVTDVARSGGPPGEGGDAAE
jgi:ParB family chromosome partitioning protein